MTFSWFEEISFISFCLALFSKKFLDLFCRGKLNSFWFAPFIDHPSLLSGATTYIPLLPRKQNCIIMEGLFHFHDGLNRGTAHFFRAVMFNQEKKLKFNLQCLVIMLINFKWSSVETNNPMFNALTCKWVSCLALCEWCSSCSSTWGPSTSSHTSYCVCSSFHPTWMPPSVAAGSGRLPVPRQPTSPVHCPLSAVGTERTTEDADLNNLLLVATLSPEVQL